MINDNDNDVVRDNDYDVEVILMMMIMLIIMIMIRYYIPSFSGVNVFIYLSTTSMYLKSLHTSSIS